MAELDEKLKAIQAMQISVPPTRSQNEIIEEILSNTREQLRRENERLRLTLQANAKTAETVQHITEMNNEMIGRMQSLRENASHMMEKVAAARGITVDELIKEKGGLDPRTIFCPEDFMKSNAGMREALRIERESAKRILAPSEDTEP